MGDMNKMSQAGTVAGSLRASVAKSNNGSKFTRRRPTE
jgi:hypothetical protein